VISHFEEITGQGIVAIIDGITVKVGSRPFVNCEAISYKQQFILRWRYLIR
jgi:cation transport ATPase